MAHLQIHRRGTAAAMTSFTPSLAELVFDTTNNVIHIGDNSTLSGFPLHKFAASVVTLTANSIIFADSSTTLNNSANLAWSGTLLTVTGGLTVTGTSTLATSLTGMLKGASGVVSAVTGATNRVTFWSDANTLSSNAGFTYDGTTLTLDADLTFTGAQTIQTSTGNLTLATAAANGNVVVTPHGTGYLSVTNGIINRGFSTNGSNNNSNYITLTRANNTGEDNVLQWITASTSQWVLGSGSSYFGGEVFGLRYAPGSTNYLTMSTAGLLTLGGSLTFTGAQTISTSSGILTVTGTGGLTLTSGTSNTLLTQNSVNVFTSEGSGAIVNTLYLKAGNVGIGTTVPGVKFHAVLGGTAPSIVAATQTVAVFQNSAAAGDLARVNITSGNTAAAVLQLGDNDDDDIGGIYYDNATNYLGFRTNNVSDRMVILSGGNVGIGTTAPDRVLEINSATGINLRLTYNDADGSAANYADLLTTSAGGLTLIPSGNLINIGGGTTATQLRFLEPSGSGTNYSSFKAVAQSADINYSLPPTVGAAGTQLTDAAGDGVLTWAAAASTRKAKNIISKFSDSKKALEKVLGVSVYNFKYKKGYGTGDNDTEYTGIMADEAPWAMHFKEEILNPVNTFGYTVLSIQALNKKIEELKEQISKLLSKK